MTELHQQVWSQSSEERLLGFEPAKLQFEWNISPNRAILPTCHASGNASINTKWWISSGMHIFSVQNFYNALHFNRPWNFKNFEFFFKKRHFKCGLTLSWRSSLSYKNQSIDLPCKSMDWCLHDRDLRRRRVNNWAQILIREISFERLALKVGCVIHSNHVNTKRTLWPSEINLAGEMGRERSWN